MNERVGSQRHTQHLLALEGSWVPQLGEMAACLALCGTHSSHHYAAGEACLLSHSGQLELLEGCATTVSQGTQAQ